MDLTVLSATSGPAARVQTASTYLVGEALAVDAGVLGFCGSVERQRGVTDVVLTHAHADHIAALPVFLENAYSLGPACPRVHGTAHTLRVLRESVFNGDVWPDFEEISTPGNAFLSLHELVPGEPASIAGHTVTPVPVHHAVPCVGLLVDDGASTLVFSGDTSATSALWEAAAAPGRPPVAAVVLECSFPDALAGLCEATGHLNPAAFAAEVAKLPGDHRVVATHLKAAFRDEVAAELRALGLGDRLTIAGDPGTLNVVMRL